MNALADAAFLSRPTGLAQQVMPMPAMEQMPYGAGASTPYSDQELQAMGLLNNSGPSLASQNGLPMPSSLGAGAMASSTAQLRNLVTTPQLPGPGRHLQILDHTVHRIDAHTKANGEEEKEMVVSNLRHFTLKIGVLDPRMGLGRDTDLPLKAELLYENGQLVEQLATCEPLLVGKTEVVAMQGSALFKLRITSLSSHRDKQRFRIRVSPTDTSLLLREPGLSVVTTPMKCVTKLSHRSSSGGGGKATGDGEGEGEEWDEEGVANGVTGKRKRDDIELVLESQAQQLANLQKTNEDVLEQLVQLKQLLMARVDGANGVVKCPGI